MLALLGAATAFSPSTFSPRVLRRAVVTMSHFSTVRTQLKNKELLLSSLNNLGLAAQVAPSVEERIPVRGYAGKTVLADIAIAQANGQDIGFRWNGKTYEMVADLEFWAQGVSVERFLEKITQRYSVNAVLESAAEGGFTMEQFVENKVTNTIEIEMYRYVV